MRLENLDFKKMLPHWMREEDFDVALADEITDVLSEPGEKVKTLRTWDQLDYLTSEELDELAWEINIDWWRSSWDLETKRNVVKTAQAIINKRGTKWSVEQLVILAYGEGKVTEWFEELGGHPYYFKIETNAPSTEEGMRVLKSMIDKVKPARAHMEKIDFKSEILQTLYTGTGHIESMTNVIVMDSSIPVVEEDTIYAGTAGQHRQTNIIGQNYEQEMDQQDTLYTGTQLISYHNTII